MSKLPNTGFYEATKKWVGYDILNQDRNMFAVSPDKDLRISDGRVKLLVGHAVNVINAMLAMDAEEPELRDAYRYLFVCIECQKYRLDPKAAKKALNIEEYENKYWRKQV